jgi:hypothetical protein
MAKRVIRRMYLVTESIREYLTIVSEESQCGQIPELMGPMQSPSGDTGMTAELSASISEVWGYPGEHLGMPVITLGVPADCW